MFYVRPLDEKSLPIFSAPSFLAVCKWCAKTTDTRRLGIFSKKKATKRTPNPPFILEAEFENDLI